MTDVADLARRLRAAGDAERAARDDLKAAENDLRALGAELANAGNALAGFGRSTIADNASKIEAAEAELTRVRPLLEAAEARAGAARTAIERARAEQARLSQGNEVTLAVWFHGQAAAKAEQARTALEETSERLSQADRASQGLAAARDQAEQARAKALDEAAVASSRTKAEQARTAADDASNLASNLAARVKTLGEVLSRARSAVETARRAVWLARRDEVLTALRPELTARLSEAYVASLAACQGGDYPTFIRATLDAERPPSPADLEAIGERMAAELGIPPRPVK